MKSVRICLVGTGRAGMVHAFNFRHRIAEAQLVATVDANEAVARERAGELDVSFVFDSIESALSQADFDAVCIATPTFTHASIVIAAAQAGKHILCEKPMAITIAGCDRILRSAQETATIIYVGHNMRHFSTVAKMKELIEKLAQSYDRVVLDVPAVLGIPDAKTLTDLCDGMIIVVKAGSTPADEVTLALDVVDQRRVLGMVLNGETQGTDRYGHGSVD